LRRTAWVVAGAAAVKLILSCGLELTSVESYLWVCAQRPALGYFDYPGMAPWLIGLSTSLFGHAVPGVRALTIACGAGTAWMLYLAARRLYGERAGERAGMLAAVLPLFFVHGSAATPDAPQFFFWSAAFWALAVVFGGGPRGYWLLAGLFAGLAMESKYQAVFLPAGVLAFLAASPDHRGWLARRDPYLAAGVALLAFVPTVAWNAAHGWASFLYQGVSRFGERGFRARELVDFPLSQLAWLTPAPALIGWIAAGRAVARWRTSPWSDRLCVALGLPLLLFFAAVVFVRPVRGHWAAPAYASLIVLASATPTGWARRLLDVTVRGAAVAWVGAALALAFVPADRVNGWSRLAAEVGKRRPDFVVGREYHLASQLGYHLRPLPAVEYTALGRPSKAFPHWWNGEAFRGASAVVVTDPQHVDEERAWIAGHFDRVGPEEVVDIPRFRGRERFLLLRADGYRP
jgi:4-amino-4-deoxy-L-arabinose transferase-like glycosyltransferase